MREQAAKQESMILSLQDGGKFLQQQMDLLNRELREAKKEVERLDAERKTLAARLEVQEAENRKLAKENQARAAKNAHTEQMLQVEDRGGESEEVAHPLAAVGKAAEEALGRNGYAIRVGLRVAQRAVYVTERKSSPPASLELPGFRNQYLVTLQTVNPTRTRIQVRAEFEKIAQGGRVLAASAEETAELERRLISEIGKTLVRRKV